MFLDVDYLPAWLVLASSVAAMVLLAVTVRYADWRTLGASSDRVNCLGGAVLLLLVFHLLSIRVVPGVSLHLLGVAAVTLVLGLRFTLVAGAAAVLLFAVSGGGSLLAASLAWLVSTVAPAVTTRLLAAQLRQLQSRNAYVFIMAAGFGGGVLGSLIAALAAMATLLAAGHREWFLTALESWPVIVLIAIPEGIVCGMLVTAFVVFAPDIMKLFDAADYSTDS